MATYITHIQKQPVSASDERIQHHQESCQRENVSLTKPLHSAANLQENKE